MIETKSALKLFQTLKSFEFMRQQEARWRQATCPTIAIAFVFLGLFRRPKLVTVVRPQRISLTETIAVALAVRSRASRLFRLDSAFSNSFFGIRPC